MTAGSLEAQLQSYGEDIYERCAERRLTADDAVPSSSRFPRAVFVAVLTLFVVGVAAVSLRQWSRDAVPAPSAVAPDGAASVDHGTSTAPDASVPDAGASEELTVDKATVRQWIEDAQRHFGVSVGDPCPTAMGDTSGLVMGLSVLDPIGFGACRVVAFAPLDPGRRDEGNLPIGDYDENGNLLDQNSPNMPVVDWASPVTGLRPDGSLGVVGTQICISDSNGDRYCSDHVTPTS